MKKKILVVDDSALMRRVICDIINSDNRFEVVDIATNGLEAFDLLSRKSYDAVVLDVNMPKMNGIQLLEKLRQFKIAAKVLMASTDTKEGAQITLGLEPETEYEVTVDGEVVGTMSTNLGGKLSLSVEVDEEKAVAISVCKK